MRSRAPWFFTAAWLAFSLLLAGCGDDVTAPTPSMPDFSLRDVNPASATYNQLLSPRHYLGKVSAWYFGHAT